MEIFNELISIKEACKTIGIKEATLRWHIAQGNFKKGIDCRKYGSTWVFKKQSLKRMFKEIPLGLERGEFTKENYPEMIEPKDICDYSNLIGYIPSDENLEYCPRLIIDKNVVLGFFRGYWIQDIYNKSGYAKILPYKRENKDKSSEDKSIDDFNTISDAINYLLKKSGLEERYFTDDELDIINKWYNDSKDLYFEYWEYTKKLILK